MSFSTGQTQPMCKSMAFERNRAQAPGKSRKLLLATSMLWDAQCLHGQQEPFKCLSPLRRQSLPAGHRARRQRRHDAQRDLPVCEVQTGVQHHRSMARDCRVCTCGYPFDTGSAAASGLTSPHYSRTTLGNRPEQPACQGLPQQSSPSRVPGRTKRSCSGVSWTSVCTT
jgi:hypothetical protein